MSLELKVNQGIKEAMLAKETVRLTALRAIKAEILLAKTADGSSEISDEAVLKIIQKLVKQRRESAEMYAQNGRPELAENELAEAGYLEAYLPKPLTAEELKKPCGKSSPKSEPKHRPIWGKSWVWLRNGWPEKPKVDRSPKW